MLNSIFEKLHFTANSRPNIFLKVKLPNMTDWHILPGFKIDVECSSRDSASGDLQKFAAVLILSTPQISQPCNQN